MNSYDSPSFLKTQLETKKYHEIAKDFGVSISTIRRRMTKFGFTNPQKKWSKKEKQILNLSYSNKEHLEKLLKKRSKQALYKMAFKLNIKRKFRKRLHKVNEHFFDKWTSSSAYVLGWLYSDGNVTQDKRTFRFHQNKKDLEVFIKIKKLMKSNHKIKISGNYLSFVVHSTKMCKRLIKLGCMPRKAKKIRFPKNIPANYTNHFVRGYFDGDGSISFNKPNTIRIRFIGNERFMKALKKEIYVQIGLKGKTKEALKPLWKIDFYGDNARNICKWMYKNSKGNYLKRKHDRYERHKMKRRENGRISPIHNCK
jgi:hypothetical protein